MLLSKQPQQEESGREAIEFCLGFKVTDSLVRDDERPDQSGLRAFSQLQLLYFGPNQLMSCSCTVYIHFLPSAWSLFGAVPCSLCTH